MSFNVVAALWIAKLFVLYSVLVFVLPRIVLHKFFAGRSMVQKFVICVVFGNFFYIMLVLCLGLFHITNRYVLIGATLVIPAVMIIRKRKILIKNYIKPFLTDTGRFLRYENSLRFVLRKWTAWLGVRLKKLLKAAGRGLRCHAGEFILFMAISGFIVWYFSITDHFGPRFSDLVVHMYWINEVDNGNLFCDGIYPFGMHALIYYMHAVFDIPTVRIVLWMGPVQTFYIFIMLLCFLKTVCRFRYTPYLCFFAFVVGDYVQHGRFSRYYATLPQEYGMIFLLPCAMGLIWFFHEMKKERMEYRKLKKEKLLYTAVPKRYRIKDSAIYLWLLIISFGLTLSVHFYDTIIAVFLVLAGLIAFADYLLHWKTLRKIIVAGLLAFLIPIAPMAAAYAGGTPLQSSLYWALEIIGIEQDTKETDIQEEITDSGESDIQSSTESISQEGTEDAAVQEMSDEQTQTEQSTPGMKEKVLGLARQFKQAGESFVKRLILTTESDWVIWKYALLLCVIMIPLMWICREWYQGRYLLMTVIYQGLLLFMAVSGFLGFPSLMDENRSSIYFSYTALAVLSLAVDGILVVGSKVIRFVKFWQVVSFGLVILFVGYTVSEGRIKDKIINASSLQKDGAALCVYDIMENYPDKIWTIVSCNEERNMISSDGWHYEVIDFLDSMENYEEDDEMYIPTKYVFFFVEKKVLNYGIAPEFEEVDSSVSQQWADVPLPAKNGLSQYSSQLRIVVNSRMYYWAQEYQKRFPNELKVYYEDDEFVCYYIEQNEYSLNNFAIDYGFNTKGD